VLYKCYVWHTSIPATTDQCHVHNGMSAYF